ncbi:MAG: sel1 repeat family protein [Dokdonella sp.]
MTFVPAFAQSDNLPTRYDSSDNVNRPANWNYATPEDDARPGEKFYFRGVHAFQHKDYSFAVNMYQVAASWAYKPAQYNLAIMYLKGQGIPVDRQRAMAWMALASERNDPQYVQARELIYAELTPDEFTHSNAIWRELKPTYGDEVALARAKMRWAQVRAAMTGSHVGGTVGNLQVGGASVAVKPVNSPGGLKSAVNGFATSGGMLLGGGSEDGAISYRQLRDSDNPYDPKFEWRNSPFPIGTATVGPISETKAVEGASEQTKKPDPKQHDFY